MTDAPVTPGPASRDGGTARRGRGLASVGLGSLLSAIAMYVVMMIGGWTLDVSDGANLLIFLGAYQIGTGMLAGLSTELTRTLSSAKASGRSDGPRVFWVAAIAAGSLSLLFAATSPLWSSAFRSDAVGLSAAVCLTALGFAGHSALVGALSGRGLWHGVGALVTLEALVRLLLTVLVAVAGFGVGGFAAAIGLASFAWVLMLLLSSDARSTFSMRSDVEAPALALRLAASVGALSATAILTVGFPLLIGLVTTENSESLRALLQAISLTRAPLLIPLTAFQSVLISHVVAHSDRAARILAMLGGGILAISALGALLAWLIGPWLMRLFFSFAATGSLLAVLTAAAGLLAALVLAGALCQALDRHAHFLAGWVVAAGSATMMLFLIPADIEIATTVALTVGPLLGITVMAPALAVLFRRQREPLDPPS